MSLYALPRFRRGSGLGNLLFPWARARVFADVHAIPMLAPHWVRARIGPALRGGVELRSYAHQILLVGLFERPPDAPLARHQALLRLRARTVAEPEDLRTVPAVPGSGPTIVEFAGDGPRFEALAGWHAHLRSALFSVTRPKWRRIVDRYADVPIGVNVRLGKDFRAATDESEYFRAGAVRTPIQWFVDSLACTRQLLGFPATAVVVSDGTASELAPLLRMEAVRFARPGCAITDLLTLANTQVLIGSMGSSFSAWAAYLGQMTTVTHPGQSFDCGYFRIPNDGGQYVGPLDPAAPPAELTTSLTRSGLLR